MPSPRSPDEPRHLLHVFATFGIGGPAVRMAGLMNHFAGRYHHTVIAVDGVTTCRARLSPAVRAVFPASPPKSRNPFSSLLAARRILRQLRADVVLTYNWGAIDWALAHGLKPFGRHVHFEDGFGPQEAERQLRRRVYYRRLALRRADRVVVPSTTLRALATDVWRLAPARVALIPNGIDADLYCRPNETSRAPDAPLVVGTLAPLRAEKNLGLLLDAVARVASRRNVRLVIAGEGPERPALEARARSLGIADRVRLAGNVDDVANTLAQFDIYALSSMTEQLPISQLEAMAAGLPVAAVDVGDVRHALSEDNKPLVVPRGDGDGLGRAIEMLAVDAGLRHRLGAANRRHVREHYAYAQMADAYDALLSA